MIKTLATLPYELARRPLVFIDDKLPETSVPRVTLDRAIGSADKVAGALLGNREIAQRGADRIDRSRKLVTAEQLENEADARREQARETAVTGRQEATAKRKAAQERAARGLDEADTVEAREKQQAKAKASKSASAKKAAAKKRASTRTATIEQRKERVASAAEAKKKATERRAKAELDDARETKQSAAQARADAERLSELTEAKKEERKQD